MVMTESKIKKWGNSLGIIIPKEDAKMMELKEGETIIVDFIRKKSLDGFGIFKKSGPFVRDHNILDRDF